MALKVCHMSRFTPRRSGLYEATRDLIMAERAAGLDSLFIDYEMRSVEHCLSIDPGMVVEDEGLTISPWEAAKDADIWVLHRGIPDELMPLFKTKRTVAVLHGTTENMLVEDIQSQGEKSGVNMHINMTWEYNATIAVNAHDYQIMKYYDKNGTLSLVHDAVDMARYTPEGTRTAFRGRPAVLAADIIRINKNPASVLWAMPMVRKQVPAARLEMMCFELAPIIIWRNILCRAFDPALIGSVETIQMMNGDLRPAMRGADIGWNCNMSGIPSRATIEMMACGTPVLSSAGSFSAVHAHPFDLPSIAAGICVLWERIEKNQPVWREAARAYAVSNFNVRDAVERGFIPIYEGHRGEYAPRPWVSP